MSLSQLIDHLVDRFPCLGLLRGISAAAAAARCSAALAAASTAAAARCAAAVARRAPRVPARFV